MVEIEIMTNQSIYSSGDQVEGEVRVTSDDEFKYNAIHLTFIGREHTRIVVSHGKTTSVHTDERVYFSQRIDAAGEGTMSSDGYSFPFQFTIPENVPSSYKGVHGWIEYKLIGVIERAWSIDPKREIQIEVRNSEKMPSSQSQHAFIEDKGYEILSVEVEDDTVALGDEIRVRMRLEQDTKMRGVRVEIIAEEEACTKHYNRSITTTLAEEFTERIGIQPGLWKDAILSTNESMPYTFSKEILFNRTYLKVTLDIPWRRDKSITIPMTLGHFSRATKDEPTKSLDFDWGL